MTAVSSTTIPTAFTPARVAWAAGVVERRSGELGQADHIVDQGSQTDAHDRLPARRDRLLSREDAGIRLPDPEQISRPGNEVEAVRLRRIRAACGRRWPYRCRSRPSTGGGRDEAQAQAGRGGDQRHVAFAFEQPERCLEMRSLQAVQTIDQAGAPDRSCETRAGGLQSRPPARCPARKARASARTRRRSPGGGSGRAWRPPRIWPPRR